MRFIGRREGVAEELQRRMDWAESETADERRASRSSSPSTTAGAPRSSTPPRRYEGGGEEEFREHLYAPEMHDPDLLIRTSGEQRISNYLLWQCAYSEFVFRDELWPDFDREAFRGRARRPTRSASGASGRDDDARGPRPASFQFGRGRGSRARGGGDRREAGDVEPGYRRGRRRLEPAHLRSEPRGPENEPERRGPQRSRCQRLMPGDVARPPRSGSWSRFPGSSSRSSIVGVGGDVFTLAMVGLGVLGLREFFRMAGPSRPIVLPAYAAVAGDGDRGPLRRPRSRSCWSSRALFPLVFVFAAARRSHEAITISIAFTVLGVAWMGLGFSHAVLLRDLPDARRRAADRRPRRHLPRRHRRLRGRPPLRLAQDHAADLTEQDARGPDRRLRRRRPSASGSPASTRTGCPASTPC